jgi:aldehyde:ferredoxin oxidoreductase
MYGYFGRFLRVNLTTREVSPEPLTEDTARKYMGGRGFAAKILFEELDPGIDPLGPQNKTIFVSGPITGSGLPGDARFQVISKSPLTGLYGQASAGGSFGPALKRTGHDFLVVEGQAEEPVWLLIDPDGAEIRDAGDLWGMPTGDAENRIKREVGQVSVATIGPAGEKLVRISSVVSDKHRVAGRGGLGAVMGSKRLKAVAARGRKRLPVAEPQRLRVLRQRMLEAIKASPGLEALGEYGTSLLVLQNQKLGILPTRNFREGVFENYADISGIKMSETILKRTLSCPGCPVGCIRSVEIKSGSFAPVPPDYGGPEYETVAALGSMCGVGNLEAIARSHALCNMYGIDTMSAGVTIAWVMECYEKGILSTAELDGIAADWGSAEAMVQLVEKIATQDGIGHLLGQGVRRASEAVGRGSQEFAMHVKGLEVALQEPRGRKGLSLAYAVSPRGAVHTELPSDMTYEKENAVPELGLTRSISRFAWQEKPGLVKKGMEMRGLADLIGSCHILLDPTGGVGRFDSIVEALQATTGWDLSISELMTISERANNLARAFNVREGSRRPDDILPKRFTVALPEGASAGETIPLDKFNQALEELYQLLGWNYEGIPTRDKLVELGLEAVAADLERIGVYDFT